MVVLVVAEAYFPGKIQSSQVGTLYVLLAGTRAAMLKDAKDFEVTSAAKIPTSFVTKDNEPNDIGINGVAPDASKELPLDVSRNSIIRVVQKQVKSGKPL